MDSGTISSFDKVINHQNTQFIRQWLLDKNPSLSDLRNVLSPGLTSESFNRSFDELAQATWFPKLQEGFEKFDRPRDRLLTRNSFEAENEEMSEDICHKSISACYEILMSRGFSHEQAILFLKEPSILYNRVFCYYAIYIYRSTQTRPRTMVANDNKDVDYLFLTHHAEHLMSNDTVMKQIFSHLKKSHKILSKMETGL